ncbi:hypothetical protein KUW19_00720 [Ferrimonas balearica]|uniref:hypothetical protein n=1 Tax=Ferrimonas balearica TaxID=44012 RepID=UPI001C93FA20|nr:hypothetical protein [Ferrimonas balearica]MBY6104999.1 hypothetical protein [Ferrimonas balearica]
MTTTRTVLHASAHGLAFCYSEGDRYHMSSIDGQGHTLHIPSTSPERLAAHWAGFCSELTTRRGHPDAPHWDVTQRPDESAQRAAELAEYVPGQAVEGAACSEWLRGEILGFVTHAGFAGAVVRFDPAPGSRFEQQNGGSPLAVLFARELRPVAQ